MIIYEELGDAGSYEALSPTTATGITASLRHPTSGIHKGRMARAALIVVETQAIRFRIDGTYPDPSATQAERAYFAGTYGLRGSL